ncbi:insulin-like growth factor I isoform X2 [Colias croceus]|uniref:insulin-like growth factor I isoform X2 n=1 Tax=Colias crocea TaxID=72248 RepID=UPI001E27A8D9|nr:insulin-like growth factor I isoform X2 [Colias croceus]
MLVKNTVCFAVITLFFMWDSRTDAATTSLKLCGRKLVEAMERVCKEYNSPPWDVPTVIEQPAGIVRRKRQMGIADQCCISTCHMTELLQYCAVIKLESPLEVMDEHMIEDRSAEASSASSPAVVAEERATGARRENLVKNAARAAPVVGTVSPLLTWGRTLNTDLPSADRHRYAYVAVYS